MAQGCVSLRKDSGKFQFIREEEAWAAIAEYKAENVALRLRKK